MWLAFAHVVIFALVVFGLIVYQTPSPQRESILTSMGVGVIVIIIYTGPLGILSAVSAGLIAYGYSKSQ